MSDGQSPKQKLKVSEKADRTEDRIARILDRVDPSDTEMIAEIEWLAGRYRRSERNLEKISRMSDRMQGQIMELNQQLQAAAVTDPLTGLLNRRGAHDALVEAIETQKRLGGIFSVAILDIDHFKSVNDTHGHDVGDEVLVAFSRKLKVAMDDEDIVARWGGEEFLVLVRTLDAENAGHAIGDFLDILRATPFETSTGSLPITASCGICQHDADGDDYDGTIYHADQALYDAKRGGRDRYELSSE